MRRAAPIVAIGLLIGACAPAPQGPSVPIAAEQFEAGGAVDASAARQAVIDFVRAYAASGTQGAAPLADLVAGPKLSAWVRWLDVQDREFDGTIDATADLRNVRFLVAADTPQTRAVQVGLSASVTFDYAPAGAGSFERARVLDGPVTLVRVGTGDYRVYDLVRDGVPMSDGIQIFRNETRTEGQVEVVLDSLFMFAPSWQFNVIVHNGGPDPLIIDPQRAGLYVESASGSTRLDGPTSAALQVVPPGADSAGVLEFDQQDSADGRVLSLVYGIGGRAVHFDFPLQGLVTSVPAPAPTGAGSATGPTA